MTITWGAWEDSGGNGMRAGTRAIESVGDTLPSYWGAQAEIVLREPIR